MIKKKEVSNKMVNKRVQNGKLTRKIKNGISVYLI